MPETAVHVASGKVREIFELDSERLLLVASDRISTFDVVLPTEIPDKGRVLTGLSGFWFARTREIVPNHLLALRPDGRSTEAKRLQMLPIECVVRGYLAGSGWKDYCATGATSGHELPAGLRESDRLPAPIFTPATKAQTGHDENIDRTRAAELVGDRAPRGGRAHRPRALPPRIRVRSGARRDHRRHEVRARLRRERRSRSRRRGSDAGFLPLLARGRVFPRRPAAVLRQAVRQGLLRAARLGQGGARAGAPQRGRRRRRAPAT